MGLGINRGKLTGSWLWIPKAYFIYKLIPIPRASVATTTFPCRRLFPVGGKNRASAQACAGRHRSCSADPGGRRKRAVYIQRHFGQDWTNRHLYNLMICSSIGIETACQTILCAAGLLENTSRRDP